MTLRALLIGLAGALFIAGLGYVNDWVLMLESFTSGSLLPVIVLGLMILAVLTVNPLLVRWRPSAAFRPAEIGLIVVLMMAACSIPGRGLMEQFCQVVAMPHHWNRITPGWKENKLLDYVPPRALVDPADYDNSVTRFITGSPQPSSRETTWLEDLSRTWGQVPWAAWHGPFTTWLPLIFLTAIASTCLALIVHRQWSSHEFLSYPIADFISTLTKREEGKSFASIFSNRLFWIGFGVVFLIRINNGLYVWFPDYLIPVRMSFSMSPFATVWPSIMKEEWGPALLNVQVFPLAIAFAFFMSSEIAFTLGVSQFLWVLFAIPMVNMGISLATDYGKGGWSGWQRAGSYVALGLMLLYTGRHYYRELLVRAVLFWRRHKPEDTNVWACRVLIVATVLLVVLVNRLGLDFPFAVLTVLLMLLGFVMVSRISAETGLFFIQPRWQPFGVLLAMFGSYAMDPQAIIICALVGVVLCIDQSQGLMPYLINGLKISENLKLTPSRVAGVTLGMYLVAVVAAIVIALCAIYNFGTPTQANWSFQRIPSMPFLAGHEELLRLKASGLLEQAEQLSWYEKLGRIHPKPNFVWAAGFGFVMVLVFSVLRLRLPWWPLHPVLFLLWATYPMAYMCHSFLMGWMIKEASVRFGGAQVYQKLRPLMVGIIAAEIMGALAFMIVGAIYFAHTGQPPVPYRYFPR
ncbi:MAG: hypothetical protein A3K19_27200 [Lentisphaerae bacterium RIFOXYB12_FULL_65_16]|nr:MAG: hypothetical protein A3K18_16075 [Lentisphaerae bacterium RIFOXYA12_64_32]OGV86377.1 MAG: hypothetical protein A3K19_27200 [Lentisphaerae bacterium RIFOXYB12_FULL_65_16]